LRVTDGKISKTLNIFVHSGIFCAVLSKAAKNIWDPNRKQYKTPPPDNNRRGVLK
jgi:hypothetical protein